MNGERIPALREDITIDVHTDADGTQHLLLNDDLGLIDAPILLELELLEVLELLDGIRTWGELRKHINLEDNEAQWLRFKAFLGELDRMGFFGSDAKRPVMIQNLRTMFTRLGATEQEVRTLRGIVKALVHGKGAARRS
ncbi:MAG: hypothetical protein MUC47_11115 [Candidatus Kapabacteria bacterium]|nr:hypothetical protein [Candidatus Kapabacteria bacterium]